MFEFDSKLLKAPKTLKELVYQCKQKGQILNKRESNNSKHSFFDNFIMDIFLFIATILSMIAKASIDHIVCKHEKLKALITGIAFQFIKQTEAIFGTGKEKHNCTAMVYNSSINFNDHGSYNLCFGDHRYVQYSKEDSIPIQLQ